MKKEKKQNKKERKQNQKFFKGLKITTVVLLVALFVMVGFFGVYSQEKNRMVNGVKDYKYDMDLNGGRILKLSVSSDATDEEKTEANYETAKEVIEKRLKNLDVEEYKVRLNKQTGDIEVEIPENSDTDTIISDLTAIGKFEITDASTNEVLLDNSKVTASKVLYNTTSSGTSIYLEIDFNKEGKDKLAEISKTYVASNKTANNTEANTTENTAENTETANETNTESANNTEATNTTADSTSSSKKVTLKLDDTDLMTTSFDEAITSGRIQLSVGQASSDQETIEGYHSQAQSIAVAIDSGKLPVKYEAEKNQYVLSVITEKQLQYTEITMVVIAAVGIVILIAKYKSNGLLAGIAYAGLSAIYLLTIRYTNVIVSIESIIAMAMILILNYIFTDMLLKNIKKEQNEKVENPFGKATTETYIKFFVRIIPICIMTIAFCFIKWVPVNSFGMTSFWGLTIIAIYNAIITRYLLKTKAENK